MIRTKRFPTADSLASYFNKGEAMDFRLISAAYDPASSATMRWTAIFADETQPTSQLQEDRERDLYDKIRKCIEYSPTVKRNMGYTEAMLDDFVAPFARVDNSLRNLKSFKDLTPAGRQQWIRDNLPRLKQAKFQIVDSEQTERAWGYRGEAIEMI